MSDESATLTCRICGCNVEEGKAIGCCKCGAAFHKDCWEFNGQCGIYGCGATEFGKLALIEQTEVLAIDEATTPPWRIEPYLESFIRKLPTWGRAFIPPISLGLVGAATVYGLGVFVFGQPAGTRVATILMICGGLMSFLAALLGPLIQKAPLTIAAFFATLGTFFFYILNVARMFRSISDILGVGFIVAAAIFASSLVERLIGPLKALQERDSTTRGVVRGLATMVFLFFYFVINQLFLSPYPHFRLNDWPLIFSVFGLFVACPPLELSKSALMHRLKAEAAREAERVAEEEAREIE